MSTTSSTQKFWKIKRPDEEICSALQQELSVHPIIAQLLANRGITNSRDAQDFLNADLSALHDPFLLKDINVAIERIRLARTNRERVLIFGDYDVDGVTSSVLMHNALKNLGIDVINHIPHRMHDGYGLNENVLKMAKENNIKLLLTVDCGITANREVALLNDAGIDVIIFDHHEPAECGLPAALAIVNPKRKDCPYPFKHLATVGLVAKFTEALMGKFQSQDLDLVTLGTIADVVPLKGENRLFVKFGLPQMHQTQNKGLSALIDVAKIRGKTFRPYLVGFVLGPRINATGRMDSAKMSLDLLLCDNDEKAYSLAMMLENMNAERQKLQRLVVQEALTQIEKEINFKDHKVIVLSKEGWHKGVLGIVASLVTEMYYRPTIVISLEDGVGTASARSIAGFHMHAALTHCSEILENYGGHQLAAGLTIRAENISQFKNRINDFARGIQFQDMVPTLTIDCEIALSNLSLELVKDVDLLEPYGEGNHSPIFSSRQVIVKSKPMVLGKETLKFWVTDGKKTVSAIGFGMAGFKDCLYVGQKVDLAYELSIDDWNKPAEVQLKLKDIKESSN